MGKVLLITADQEGFRRAGLGFGKSEVRVAMDDLDERQVEALTNEPRLSVTIAEAEGLPPIDRFGFSQADDLAHAFDLARGEISELRKGLELADGIEVSLRNSWRQAQTSADEAFKLAAKAQADLALAMTALDEARATSDAWQKAVEDLAKLDEPEVLSAIGKLLETGGIPQLDKPPLEAGSEGSDAAAPAAPAEDDKTTGKAKKTAPAK